MADNVNDSLKNLNQNIKDADANLAKLSKDFNVVFTEAVNRAARDAKVSIDQMFDAIAGRVGASKASKLKLLFDIVDEHGKTATPQTIQQKIDRIVNATPNARGTKLHIGMDWVDVDTANANLRRYKEQLKLIQDMPAAYDLVNRAVNAIIGEFDKEAAAKQKIIEKNEKILEQEIAIEEKQRSKAAAQQQKQEEKQYKEEQKWYDAKAKADRENERRAGESKYRQMSKEIAEYGKALQRQIELETKANQIRRDYNKIKSDLQGVSRQSEEYKKGQQVLQQYRQELHNVYQEQKKIDNEYKGTRSAVYNQQRINGLRQEYEQLRRNGRQIRENKGSLESMLPTLRRLASAFGVAFSVQGLVNFGKKLVETRGEFEMQFVAMKQIIGDVDAATKIWDQTMQQALQSPFKAMQLVDYTKKLAAYRIETDKLFDTTKRLADVSAGLGVDMGRLILAYGQVKAANFLRASEIRQFTEAGVNIVGQLSEYFTQLEGRAVSTADVMERVTKRMVLFEDVEEIFKRMTDEGGTFYNMQEVQADTVRGQINKLHDAYDQMLNTIGQANQGTIRNLIESANSLVRNWRDVASFLMKNVNAFVILLPLIATYRKGAKMAAGETFTWTRAMRQIGLELTFARNGMKKFSISTALGTAAVYMFKGAMEILKTTFRTFVPFLAIEGLMLLVTKMQAADRAANQLTKDLDEVGKRNAQSLQDNIDGFTNLVERLKKATEGSQDYLDIRNKIQNQYGEYLDNLEAEQITVENLANSYDRVVERMREKSRQHIMEEGLQEITNDYGDAIVKFQKNITGFKFTSGLQVSDKEAADIAKKMYELYAKDESYRGLQNPVGLLKDALKQYYGESSVKGLNYAQLSIGNALYKSIEARYKKQIELETKANSLTRATANTHQEYLDQLALEEEHQENINKIQQKVQSKEKTEYELQLEKIRYDEKRLELQAKYEKKSSEWLDKEKKKLKENYDAFLKSYNARVEAYIDSVYGQNWREADNEKAFKDYNAMVATQSRIAQGQSRWEESILNDKKVTEENIKRLKEEQATQTAKDAEASKHLNDELTKENHRLAIIKKQMELLGLHEKDKSKGGGSANNSIYGDRIRLLQDMLQKYRQAAKEAYGFAKAEEKTGQSFEDAWNSIMPAGYGELEVPTSYAALAEMLQRLEAFTPQFDKNGQLSKMMADLKKAIADALSNVDLEMSVRIREDFGRQMEEAFGNYELTLELQKLNIPEDAVKDLFPDFDYTSIGELQDIMEKFYNDRQKKDEKGNVLFSKDDLDAYKKWSDKIDSEILKMRKEKAQQYSKYLEKEYSERAKVEMKYAKDVAFVTANVSDDAQRKNILSNLQKKYQDDINELNWKSFKESDFYVEMMEDITSLPKEYTQMMLDKINEILQHPETLSPRALKEAINARQKVLEAQMNLEPLDVMRTSVAQIRTAISDVGGTSWKDTKEKIHEQVTATQEQINELEEEARCWDETAAKMQVYEDAVESVSVARGKLGSSTTKKLEEEGVSLESVLKEYKNLRTGFDEERQQLLIDFKKENLTDEENAIRKQLIDKGYLSESGELTSNGKDRLNYLERQNSYYQEQIDLLNELIAKEKELQSIREGQVGTDAEQQRGVGGVGTAANARARAQEARDKASQPQKRIQNLKDYLKAFTNFDKSFAKFNAAINSTLNAVHGMANAFYDMFDALGGETDALTDGWKEFGNTVITQITQTLTMIPMMVAAFTAAGIAINSALGIIGLIAEALQLVITLITGVAKLHDAAILADIERIDKRVEKLKESYEDLQKAIDGALSASEYFAAYDDAMRNLQEQIEEANKKIAAAQDIKNKDEREQQIKDAKDAMKEAEDEMRQQLMKLQEEMVGFNKDDYHSTAQDFASEWLQAFKETGNGIDALKEKFKELVENWFVQQFVLRSASKKLEPILDNIIATVDSRVYDRKYIEDLYKQADVAINEINDNGMRLASIFGIQGDGELSGLGAGIKGMTEEQAGVLEGYWNPVRTLTARIDQTVTSIYLAMTTNNVETNPMLQQITLVAQNTRNISELFEAVVKGAHPLGGSGIKVFVE